jgi:hypothetical protein
MIEMCLSGLIEVWAIVFVLLLKIYGCWEEGLVKR